MDDSYFYLGVSNHWDKDIYRNRCVWNTKYFSKIFVLFLILIALLFNLINFIICIYQYSFFCLFSSYCILIISYIKLFFILLLTICSKLLVSGCFLDVNCLCNLFGDSGLPIISSSSFRNCSNRCRLESASKDNTSSFSKWLKLFLSIYSSFKNSCYIYSIFFSYCS